MSRILGIKNLHISKCINPGSVPAFSSLDLNISTGVLRSKRGVIWVQRGVARAFAKRISWSKAFF